MGASRVVVLGGGLAGITSALDCAAAGANVALVEVRPRLGGAAYSFAREELEIDNGQHVFLRCCTAYRGLLARLGSEAGTFVQPRLEIPVLRPDGSIAKLRRSALPAPAHLAPMLLRYRLLSVAERLRAARAAQALAHVDPSDRASDAQSFGAWLSEHGQDRRAVSRLWDLVALPTLNLPSERASLAAAAFVLKTGLLAESGAADIGFHIRPLSKVIGEPALRALRQAGVEVLLGRRALRITERERGFDVSISGGEPLQADVLILALPHGRAAELLPARLQELAGALRQLGSSPIVNLHVIYDRPVSELAFAAGVDTPVQYVFDRSHAVGLSRGRYLAVSLSAAEAEMAMSVERLRERFVPALGELLPSARAAKVEQFLVTREHAATFCAAPGSGRLRPACETAVAGLLLAGSFTDTGWPATLEGAVRSGHAAARGALRAAGIEPPAASAHQQAPTRDATTYPRSARSPSARTLHASTSASAELLIAAPMSLEARLISSGAPGARILRTGIGARRARASVHSLREQTLAALLVMGFAGGLDPGSRPGEVVVADELHGPEGARIGCPSAQALAQALLDAGVPTRHGPVISVTRPALGAARERLRARGAIAADMESVWLAAAAGTRPFGVVRVLLDTPGHELWRPALAPVSFARAAWSLRRCAAVLASSQWSDQRRAPP
jgi:hydroxysqualene dehydroxylase